jgi:hypothetical protein
MEEEARLICSGRRWKWQHVSEERGVRTSGVFKNAAVALRDLQREVGLTSAVVILRRQILPTKDECRVALGELLARYGK